MISGRRIIDIDIRHSINNLIVYVDDSESKNYSEFKHGFFIITKKDLLDILQSIEYDARPKIKNIHLKPII